MKLDTSTEFFEVKPIGDVASRLSGPLAARIEISLAFESPNCTLPIHDNILEQMR
jgi:hypothetical protein